MLINRAVSSRHSEVFPTFRSESPFTPESGGITWYGAYIPLYLICNLLRLADAVGREN